MTDEERLSEEEQTGQEGGIEHDSADAADVAPDADAAAAAAAAAQEGREAAIEGVKAGEDVPGAISTPHGHEGDYDPVGDAAALPDPEPEPEAAEDDDGGASAADAPAEADATEDDSVDAADPEAAE